MSFKKENIAIIGASGAIGNAFTHLLRSQYPGAHISTFSQHSPYHIDYTDEETIAKAAAFAAKHKPLDLVITANGILHDADVTPEKSLNDLSRKKFQHIFEANTITPALLAKHFLPMLNRERTSVFAVLSARVGSISDNHLGGWYAYRASKAALNMIVKTASIEMKRKNKQAIITGLHPGTVDSQLSKPFQANIRSDKLFTPEYAAQKLLGILDNLTAHDTGKCFAWDGQEIPP